MRHRARWWWKTTVSYETKAVLLTMLLLTFGIAGYLAATHLPEDTEQIVLTEQQITVTRTVKVKGKPRVIREIRTITTQGDPVIRTVRRNGQTVTLTQPGETVVSTRTVKGPVQTRTVKGAVRTRTVKNTSTVVETQERLLRVTLPGKTLPGTTITGPERVVTTTLPERVITTTTPGETQTRVVTEPARTVTGPTQTVTGPTQTVTGPTQTVTGPTTTVTGPTTTVTGPTTTVTHTVTETETVTVTVQEPPKP